MNVSIILYYCYYFVAIGIIHHQKFNIGYYFSTIGIILALLLLWIVNFGIIVVLLVLSVLFTSILLDVFVSYCSVVC